MEVLGIKVSTCQPSFPRLRLPKRFFFNQKIVQIQFQTSFFIKIRRGRCFLLNYINEVEGFLDLFVDVTKMKRVLLKEG
jgi:hypothetical protein